MNDDYDDDNVVGHKKDEGFAFALVHSPFIVSLFASECYYSSIHVIGNCTYWQKRLFSASKIQWLGQQNQHFLLIIWKKAKGFREVFVSVFMCVCPRLCLFRSARASCTTSVRPVPSALKIWTPCIQAYMPHESSGDSSNQPDGPMGSPRRLP